MLLRRLRAERADLEEAAVDRGDLPLRRLRGDEAAADGVEERRLLRRQDRAVDHDVVRRVRLRRPELALGVDDDPLEGGAPRGVLRAREEAGPEEPVEL